MAKSNSPHIITHPSISVIDSPVKISIVNLNPGQEVTIRAKRLAEGRKRIHLSSYATFIANDDGKVELDDQEPIAGTYSGIDGMGLFWSLAITEIEDGDNEIRTSGQVLSPQTLTLSLEISKEIIEETIITRQWKSDNIARYPIRENGLVATFFCNKEGKPEPAIIVLGGSEGGLNEYLAAVLASNGFSVLALAYFGIEHLPKRLVEIPLEYVKTAIDWIKKRPETKGEWIGIHGTSRGSELALLSACLFSDIKAVISLNGSPIVFSGIVPWSVEETLPASWTYNGKPINYASPKNPVSTALECIKMDKNKEGNPLKKWYNALTSDSEIVEKATIPVEKINGPIMLISGKEDITYDLCQLAFERLQKNKSPHFYKHLVYPGAAHSIGIPYLFVNQGDKQDTARASVDSWRKTIDFYSQSLNKF